MDNESVEDFRTCGTSVWDWGGGVPVDLGFYDAEELGEVVGSGMVSVSAVVVVVV
jgi:hypothetical protein